jgi:hypothetical protein
MEMITDLAISIFVEAFADEIENLENQSKFDLLTASELAQVQDNYILGYDLHQSISELFSDFGLNIQDYLPINQTKKIVNQINFQWRGNYKMEEFYEFNQLESHYFLLDLIGQSSGAVDSVVDQLFKDKNIYKPTNILECDMSYEVQKAIQDLAQALKKVRGNFVLNRNEGLSS